MFNGLLNFLGGVGRAVGNVFQPRPQQPQSQPQQRPQTPSLSQFLNQHLGNLVRNPIGEVTHDVGSVVHHVAQPVIHQIKSINGQPLQNFVNGVANTHLHGIEQLTGQPTTIGSVAQNTPVLKQAIQFGQNSAHATVPQFVKGIATTGAKYAPYVAPELGVIKLAPGAGLATKVAAKAVNNFVPGAATQAISDVAQGQRNPIKIAQNAATAGAINAGGSLAAAGAGKVLKAATKEAKAGFPNTLASEVGAVGKNIPKPGDQGGLQPIKPTPNIQKALDQGAAKQTANGETRTVIPAKLPLQQPGLKERGLTTGIKKSDNYSPELQASVKSVYTPFGDKAALASHEQFMQQGVDNANKEAISVLSNAKSDIGKQEVVNYGKTIQALDAAGRTQEATAIHDLLAQRLTEGGQRSQAASLLYNRTPEGLQNSALKDLRNAKVAITPELQKEIQGHIDTIKGLPAGPSRDFAVAVMQKAIAKHLPQNPVNQAISVWKAGLLSGVKTQGGNFVSNGTFAGLKKASDPGATLVDKGISLITGKRMKTLTNAGIGQGVKEGARNAGTTLKTGIDVRNIGDKYEQHAELNFKNKWLNNIVANPTNMIFRGMNAADQPFWYAALKNSLYDQAKADGINAGLSGKALRDHMDKLVQNPTEKMASVAESEANKSTLGYDTLPFKAIQGMKSGIERSSFSPAGKAAASTAIDVLAPFTKVPTAFLSRTVDFTPLGPIKEVLSQVARHKFDQRQLAQAISEGATGTGIVALGITLANNNMLSGDYPKNNPKEAARWKAEGIIPNAVKINGTWISMNYLGPIGLLFNAGRNMAEAASGGESALKQAGAALASLGQGLVGQSFLQGFSGFSDAIKDPTKVGSYVNSQAASVVPSIVNDIGNATDTWQRQANSVLDAIKARVPGLRESLPAKIDTFGNDLPQAAGDGLQTAINPLKPSNDNHTPLLNELDRLGKTGSQNVVFPTGIKTIGQGPDSIKLTPEQANQRQKLVGAQLTPLWNSIINSPAYGKLTDNQKATALQTALKDINSAVDRTMTAQIDSSKLKTVATGNTALILSGQTPSADAYITKAAKSGTPKLATTKKTTKVKIGTTGTRSSARVRISSAAKQQRAMAKLSTRALKAPKAARVPVLKTAKLKTSSPTIRVAHIRKRTSAKLKLTA